MQYSETARLLSSRIFSMALSNLKASPHQAALIISVSGSAFPSEFDTLVRPFLEADAAANGLYLSEHHMTFESGPATGLLVCRRPGLSGDELTSAWLGYMA